MSDDIKELIGRTKNIRAWGKKNYRLYAEAADAMEVLVKECDRMLIYLNDYQGEVEMLEGKVEQLMDEAQEAS